MPVGVPLPEDGVTVAVNVIGVVEPTPIALVESVSPVVVEIVAPATVIVTAGEVEGASFAPSPLKQATTLSVPLPN